eukprot:7609635-Alexandrium_andersonii.AAC.1
MPAGPLAPQLSTGSTGAGWPRGNPFGRTPCRRPSGLPRPVSVRRRGRGAPRLWSALNKKAAG